MDDQRRNRATATKGSSDVCATCIPLAAESAHDRAVSILWYGVLVLLTVLAAVLWERQRRAARPKDERGRPWAVVVTVAALDGWLWWVASGAPWSPIWELSVPLALVNLLLALVVISDLTGVNMESNKRTAWLDAMIMQPPDRPRR